MMKTEEQQLALVRKNLLSGLSKCDQIPSTLALAALVELTLDTAVSLCGRENGVEAICRSINVLMVTKHRRGK